MLLTLLELVFVGCIVAGVALWSVPLALIVAGILGVVACELADRRRTTRSSSGEESPR